MATCTAGPRALDVPPGERVAVKLQQSPQAVLAYLDCLPAGIIYVSINPAFHAPEVAHILVDLSPALVICEAGRDEWMAARHPGGRLVALRALLAADGPAGERASPRARC